MTAALTAACGASPTGTASGSGSPLSPKASHTSARSKPPSPSPKATTTPAHATQGPATPKPTPKPATTPAPATGSYAFPVAGNVSYSHTHHDYPATDIIGACRLTVRAPASGVILEVTRVDTWKESVNAGATRGGLSFSVKGDDGVRYYGSHLSSIRSEIQPGVRVTAGQSIGKVGKTGDASACHLHFGISPVCKGVGDWWIQRGVIWPWPYLDSWRKGGHKSAAAEVAAWLAKNGCPTHALVDP
jgi:murein DD-endopeptidase MepM/ murein hydrolase activator NlpD